MRSRSLHGPRRGTPPAVPPWAWGILALAGLKVAAALGGAGVGGLATPPGAPGAIIPTWIDLVHVAVFGAAGGWLLIGGRRDHRALALGGVFLLTAGAFAGRLAAALGAALEEPAASALALLAAVQINAFLPYFLWQFAEHFPRVRIFRFGSRLGAVMVRVALAAGVVLAAASLVATVRPDLGELALVRLFARTGWVAYWPVISGLVLGALAFVAWKSRFARGAERRRARLFLAALALGIGPLFFDVLLESLVAPFGRLMDRPAWRLGGGLILYPLLLSIPFTTAYAVLVHQVFEVRLVVRKALQYALARYSLAAVVVVPFAALAGYIWERRSEPIAEVVAGPGTLVLGALGLIGIVASRLRAPLLGALDRRFFRQQYDAQRILADLSRSIRRARDVETWAALLAAEVDRALHLYGQAVLVLDPSDGSFVPVVGKGVRALAADARLVELAAAARAPFVLAPWNHEPSRQLPEEDVQWLVDGGFRALVPIVAADGTALALLALGELRSELPLSREDLALLGVIAEAAAVPLELRLLPERYAAAAPHSAGRAFDLDRPAHECPACWRVESAETAACPDCGAEMAEARLPVLLAGKYRLERRLGAGGMGVVYRGSDEALARPVAIKTLPRISSDHALRMRSEARAMAVVAHPNLAAIYAVESWRGTPCLILELLEGGTLAERIAQGPLPLPETIALGIDLAGALGRLHRQEILHRDLKPSNIGFAADDTPKLLDFGLALILVGDPAPPAHPVRLEPGRADPDSAQTQTLAAAVPGAGGFIEGTPRYMSPEALAGERATPADDLWSLAVVLWEAVAGRHPFAGEAGSDAVVSAVLARRPPDPSALPPAARAGIASFLAQALGPVRRQRPQTARDFAGRLTALG